jgi:hypothetical protein
MKHTEKKIKEIAKQTMNDIKWGFDKQKDLRLFFEDKEDEIEYAKKQIKDKEKLNKYIKTLKSIWIVGFDFEPEAELEYNSIQLSIDDDTGEPFSIRHKQAIFKILKNSEGKYYTILER